MPLLDPTSLSTTVDNVNRAVFFCEALSKQEALRTLAWLRTRFGAASAYGRGKTFGITEQDEQRRLKTFTGEALTSDASMRHIHAEEACRAMILLNRVANKKLPELEQTTEFLLGCVARSEAAGKPKGTFCCGPCTTALWRHMSVGGLGKHAKDLDIGIGVMAKSRKGDGTWRRFPFFYALSLLVEVDTPNARKELKYARAEADKRLEALRGETELAKRKRKILELTLA
jgi:hypothetical protein